MRFGASDIYLNVAGGLRVREPAADLAAAAALLSALTDQPLPQKMVAFGEVSLAGEIRPVSQMEARMKEAAKLGFTEALVPAGAADTRSAGAGHCACARPDTCATSCRCSPPKPPEPRDLPMENLPISPVDLGVLILLLISGLLAFSRGFVHEALSVAGWVGAALAVLFLLPYVSPYLRENISNIWLADGIGAAVIFIVASCCFP